MSWRYRRRSNPSRHLLVGVIFIVVGILSMMSRLHMRYALEILSRGWPLILIAVGMFKVAQCQTSACRTGGLFWIAMGALFLAAQNGYLPFNVWSLLWPGFLIWFGISMVLRSRQHSPESTDSTSTVGAMAFMGGFQRRCNSQDFQGGEITCVMGGGKIDLREAAISGERAVMNVLVLMGGLEVIIPDGWFVESKVIPLMGGVDDKTNPPKEITKRLVIEGTLVMGGIEIKN